MDDDARLHDAGPPHRRDDPAKDPSEWATGDEPMTGPQRSYLGTLAREAGVEVPDDLTKARASELIDELRARTGLAGEPGGGGGGGDPVPTDPVPSAGGREGDDAMEHRFAADEEVADGGAAGADEARTPGMGT